MNVEFSESLPFDIGEEVYCIMSRKKTVNPYTNSYVTSYNTEVGKVDGKYIGFLRTVNLCHWHPETYHFLIWEVFKTQQEVKDATTFFDVVGISDDEWEKAIGTEELRLKGEIKDCELSPCCGNISDARDYLFTCKENKGLIALDRDHLKKNLEGHYGPEYPPILKRIFKQLEICD